MSQQSEPDEENVISKRRRLTGSSKWTVNSISRQMAERQAGLDVDDMLIQQAETNPDLCHSQSPGNTYESENFELTPMPTIKLNSEVSSICDDAFELLAGHESEETPDANLVYCLCPDDEAIMEDLEFPEAVFVNEDEESKGIEENNEFLDEEDLTVTLGNDYDRIAITRLLSAAFYLKHGLSKSGLADFLDILNISSQLYGDQELKSPYMFMKQYGILKKGLKRVYPCSTCSKTLIVNEESGLPIENQPCGHKYSKDSSDKCYTLLLPVDEQLKFFIRHHGIKKANASDDADDWKGDVCTGDRYKQYVKDGIINEQTVTMQINTDGAQKFKSSKYSFWPFMGIINETGYKTRRSNVILMAIWFGNKKPPRNVFLDPCVAELKNLCSTGLKVDGNVYKIRPVIVTVDTVARPVIRNTTQFNGAFGCDFCLHPGKSVKIGRGSTLVYCEQAENDPVPKYPLRSTLQYRNDLKEALKTGKPFHGIKGTTTLSEIEDFDFIASFIPEYMHCICLGVIRYMILLWISSTHSKEPWHISKDKLTILNKRLSNAKPPYDITRTPGTFETIKYWKASEFRAFALYYFPLLEGILPEPYFSHFSNLSYALTVLLQESVPTQCVKDVEILLSDFVKKFEILYGEKHVKFNVHLLTHLSRSVLDWGCLWATSAFIPEWFNGQLQGLSNGTQSVVEQMANSFLVRNSVRNQAIDLLANQTIPTQWSKLIRRMICLPNMYEFQNSKCLNIDGIVSLSLLGKPTLRTLTLFEQSAIENCLLQYTGANKIDETEIDKIVEITEHVSCALYPRLKFRNGSSTTFTTSSYVRSKKRINFCALLQDGRFFLIENFAFFEGAKKNFQMFVFGRPMGKDFTKIYTPSFIGKNFVSLPGQTANLTGLGEMEAVLPHQIVRKCVVAAYNSLLPSFIVSALTNTLETD